MIELIALDMDGTLLTPDQVVSERNKQAILTAQKNNIEVLIATGRGFSEAYFPVKDAGLTTNYICLNGAEIRDASKNIHSTTPLNAGDIEKVANTLDHENIPYELFVGDHLYTISVERQIDLFVQAAQAYGQSPSVDLIRKEVMKRVDSGYIREVRSFDEVFSKFPDHVYKFFGANFNDADRLTNAKETLQSLTGLVVTSSGEFNIEINHVNAQKGIALEKYATSKGISLENIMAVGDSFNDLSMLNKVGRSVAMDNAPDAIKASCTHTTASNAADGVALAIEDILK